jgi:hypothetical protein
MNDYYLEDQTRLEKQPKRTIADYVESQGILVPRRFSSLSEARTSGLPILARSEHEQDYNGCSGLVDSVDLDYKDYLSIKNEEELKAKVLEDPNIGTPLWKQFCKFTGYNETIFQQEVSFSFWELLKGYKRTIIADSAVPKRYHITTSYRKDGKYFDNWSVVENGEIIEQFIQPFTAELKEGLPALIDFYEQIRNLSRFNRNHCPIMEIQTLNGKNYFLQYHRTRDFSSADFTLDRAPEQKEIIIPFVRGATSKEGMSGKVTAYYAGSIDWNFEFQDEEGSWDFHTNHVIPELRVRNRKIQMIEPAGEVWWQLLKYVLDHAQRSKLFKPQVSAIIPFVNLMKNNEVIWEANEGIIYGGGRKYPHREPILKEGEEIVSFTPKNGKNSYMMLNIVSDGKRAFVRRLD